MRYPGPRRGITVTDRWLLPRLLQHEEVDLYHAPAFGLPAHGASATALVLTVHEDEAYFFAALQAGAAGYVLKGGSASELVAALDLVAQGGVPIPRILGQRLASDHLGRAPAAADLSAREQDLLRLIAAGRSNKEIAEELALSLRTVERHRSTIMSKLGFQNKAELLAYAVRRGWLAPSNPP